MTYNDFEIVQSRLHNLTWTHTLTTLRVDDPVAARWYLQTASQEMWSVRTLDRNISTQYFERHFKQPQQIAGSCEKAPTDKLEVLKSPVVAEFLGFKPNTDYTESDLEKGQITHQDVGQMDMYVRMYDELQRTEGDNPTIGIVLCSETSKDIARYFVLHDNDHLFAAKYMALMPTEVELRREIEQQKGLYRLQQKR